MAAEAITLLIPGAGPPPTRIARVFACWSSLPIVATSTVPSHPVMFIHTRTLLVKATPRPVRSGQIEKIRDSDIRAVPLKWNSHFDSDLDSHQQHLSANDAMASNEIGQTSAVAMAGSQVFAPLYLSLLEIPFEAEFDRVQKLLLN